MTSIRGVLVLSCCARVAAADPDPADGEVIEIHDVRSVESGEVRLPIAELREIPGALGDPVRAVTMLPGMTPTNTNRPEIYVRGAPPGDTGFFIDGIRVPLVFHAGVLTSVIPGALLEAVDLFASAAPARIGGVAGGAFELETRPPATVARGEARVLAFEAGALVETPIADGRGSVLAAARLGYPQLVASLVGADDIRLDYWDYQARASWALGEHDRIGVLAFGSHDHLAEIEPADTPDTPEMEVDQLRSDFHRVDLRYDHATATTKLHAAVTGGWTRQGAGSIRARDLSLGGRVEGEARLAPTLVIRGGAHVDHDAYTLRGTGGTDDPSAQSRASAAPAPRNTTAGAYVDLVWHATPALELVPGVRFDAYSSSRALAEASGTVPAVDPRLAARLRLRPEVSLLVAAGFAHQFPLLRVGAAPATAVSVPGFWAEGRRLQRAHQASAGVEWLLPEGFTATATAFASVTYGLTDLARTCQQIMMADVPTGPCGDRTTTGHAYGLELSLRRPLTERIAGWLGYTYSHATQDAGGITTPTVFDRTHVANAALAYQISAHWRLGARLTAYSGRVFAPPAAAGAVAIAPFRLPWFERLDLRAERRWSLAGRRSLALLFDVLNATFSRDHENVHCETTCTVVAGSLFFIPSAGVEGTF